MMVSSRKQLQQYLVEAKDHGIIVEREGKEISNMKFLYINHNTEILEKILSFVS